jgi:hypothetical protein
MQQLRNPGTNLSLVGGLKDSSATSGPDDDCLQRLHEIAADLDRLGALDEGERAARLAALDEEGQVLLEDGIDRYFQHAIAGAGFGQQVWRQVWDAQAALFDSLAAAYWRAAESGARVRAQAAVRAVRAGAALVRLSAFRYGAPDRAVWGAVGRIYLEAVAAGFLDTHVVLPPEGRAGSCVAREVLKALAMQCAGFDTLPLELMRVADRLVRYVMPAMALSAVPDAGARFVWCPAESAAPRRLVARPPEDGVLYLSVGAASDALDQVDALLGQDLLPTEIATGPGAAERLASCVRHLRHCWAEGVPARRYRRHPLGGRLVLVIGWSAMLKSLRGDSEYERVECNLLDASQAGVGVELVGDAIPQVRMGELVGLKGEDGGAWRLTAIRRLRVTADATVSLGLETLASNPVPSEMECGQVTMQGFLCDPIVKGALVRLVTPSGALNGAEAVFIRLGRSLQELRLVDQPTRARGLELGRYEVL